MSIISKIRQRPNTRIEIVYNSNNLFYILKKLRFYTDAECLVHINKDEAKKILVYMLNKDMAYRDELIPEIEADKLAETLIEDFSEQNSIFYSNAKWHLKKDNEGLSWIPFTPATFDGGIIIQNEMEVICIWFEDED